MRCLRRVCRPCRVRPGIVQQDVVDEARAPGARGNRESRMAVEVRDGHVVDIEAAELVPQHAAALLAARLPLGTVPR